MLFKPYLLFMNINFFNVVNQFLFHAVTIVIVFSYIEKIDIHEEQVRLKQHCDYFRTLLADSDQAKGKKLSFMIQEIGREINTTGSKAYDAEIQKCVVTMKDELEKAKEQILNVL